MIKTSTDLAQPLTDPHHPMGDIMIFLMKNDQSNIRMRRIIIYQGE